MKFDGDIIQFGIDYDLFDINPFDLILLPQVRKKKNTKIDEIANSIEDRYLINHPDVARLDYEGFKSYIDFINQLWKKDINIDSYKPIDGYYYVVIAGHTRLEAIKAILKKYNKEGTVRVKLHKVKSSEEILAIQLDENLHKEVSIEERAIAIIETYRLGIMNGKWKDKAEFIKKNSSKNFSRDILNDALLFADLPFEIQEYVFSNNIPFAVGVELGRLFPLIIKYEMDFDKEQETIEKTVKLHCATLLVRLQQVKSIKRSLTIISAHAKMLTDHFRPKEDLQQDMSEWWNDNINRQSEMHQEYLINEYNKSYQALNSMPFENFMKLFYLDTNLSGQDHSVDINNIRKLYSQYIMERFLNPEVKAKQKKLLKPDKSTKK